MRNLVTVWQRCTSGELCWLTPQGPVGIPVVPLVWRDAPCVALPFAHLDAIETLTDGTAVFSVTDAAALAAGVPAMAATGRVELGYDLDGEIFTEHLVAQECVKHPPTRLRADSLMARRENWWWVPRILVTLVEVVEERSLPARDRPADALLVRAAGHRPRVDVVTAESWPPGRAARAELWARDGHSLDGRGERVFAFGHAHSPDFERWERWHRAGELTGDTLTVAEGVGTPMAEVAPFGMLARLRNHREVERACRAGIERVERRGSA